MAVSANPPAAPDGRGSTAPAQPSGPATSRWLLLAALLLLASAGALWAYRRQQVRLGGGDGDAPALKAQPPSSAAAAAYREGMALSRQYRWPEAVPLFKKAAGLDPAFALPPLRLTVALYFLGDSKDVVEEMLTAARLAAGAPDAVRLRVEPHYYWSQNQWEKCAAAARALRDSEPDNFEALYPSLLLTGCVPNPESLALMTRLRASASPATLDPRFDLMEGRLALAEREDRRAAEALDRAERKLTSADDRFLEAAVRRQRSLLAVRQGNYDTALALLASAEKTYTEGGQPFEAARVAGQRAEVLEAKGEFLPAAAEFERQLTLLEPFGATYAGVHAAKGGAVDYLAAGEPLKAAALLEKVKGYPPRILQNAGEVYAILGRVAMEEGNVPGAAAMVEPALNNLAKETSAADPVLLAASVEREEDKLAVARERLEGATAVVAEDQVQVRIAELLLDSQDRAAAAKVIDGLSSDGPARAQAARLRARSLLQAGRPAEAKAAAADAVEAAQPTRQVPLLQSTELELARAESASGGAAQAQALLAALQGEAKAHGQGRLLLEVGLAKVEALPRGSAARAQEAKALESAARSAGFLRLARLAHEALRH